MLLERKERSPTHEDAAVASIKNIKEICKNIFECVIATCKCCSASKSALQTRSKAQCMYNTFCFCVVVEDAPRKRVDSCGSPRLQRPVRQCLLSQLTDKIYIVQYIVPPECLFVDNAYMFINLQQYVRNAHSIFYLLHLLLHVHVLYDKICCDTKFHQVTRENSQISLN